MPNYQLVKLSDLKASGKELTAINDNALVYVVQGNQSYCATWATLKGLLTPTQTTTPDVIVALSGNAERTIQGVVEKVKVVATVTGQLTIGTTLGGTEILDEEITAGETIIFSLDYDLPVATTVYLSGPSSAITFKIW